MRNRSPVLAVVLSVLAALLAPTRAWSWAEHHAITRAALSPVTELAGKTAVYTDFGSFLKDLGYSNVETFNQQLQINKKFRFDPLLGEVAGQPVSLIDILSKYSDEPDWKMDQELFDDDEYPELWQDAYTMMGGRVGLASQAFRHMYWQKWDLLHPLKTFKLPLGQLGKAMGVAPDRAQLFVQLSRTAHDKGHDYWAARFLADALHYLEDCSQPYHATQVPTKLFLTMPLFNKEGDGFTGYVTQLTNIISYYHFSFEDYVSQLLVGAMSGDHNEIGTEFATDLVSSESEPPALSYEEKDMRKIVKAMARIALLKSAVAGRASKAFFPAITENYTTLDAHAFMNDAWWVTAKERGREDSSGRRRYFGVVKAMFEPLGYAIRQVVTSELTASRLRP